MKLLEKNIGVYLIHDIDGLIYVGSSIGLFSGFDKGRIARHKAYNEKLAESNTNYDITAFSYEILEYVSVDDYVRDTKILHDRERYWQDYYDVLGQHARNKEKIAGNGKAHEYTELTKINRKNASIISYTNMIESDKLSRIANISKSQKIRHANMTDEQQIQRSKTSSMSNSRPIVINNITYCNIKTAVVALNETEHKIRYKLDSVEFPTYIRLYTKRTRNANANK